jgi:hypothetical protein
MVSIAGSWRRDRGGGVTMKKKDVTRRAQDAAGVGPYARERSRLVPLSEKRGWNVISGEADIRSWEVRTLAGRILGHVRELLVDPGAGEVVLLDIDRTGSDQRALVPIRLVEVDRVKRVVRADSGDLEDYQDSPGVRLSPEELGRVGGKQPAPRKTSKPAERVVERRPIVEETVVRRRIADDTDTRL